MTGQTGVGFREHSLLFSTAESLLAHPAEAKCWQTLGPLQSLIPGQWAEDPLRMAVLSGSLDLFHRSEQPSRTIRHNQLIGGPGMSGRRDS